jgi:hypothetical protein
MSSQVYCTASDLAEHFARIDDYDLKINLSDYRFVQHSGNTFKLQDSGSVLNLFLNGEDQGDPVANVAALSSDYDWVWESDEDCLYILFASGDVPTDNSWKIQSAPKDSADAKTAAIAYASEMLESILDNRIPRPIPKTKASKTAGVQYDYWIVMSAALLACWHLVRSSDPGSEDVVLLQKQIGTVIGGAEGGFQERGIIDKINDGSIKLSFELTSSDKHWVDEVSVGNDTTGFLADPDGDPSLDYEVFLVTITGTGTLTVGTLNSTLKYSVKDSQNNAVFTNEVITGLRQQIGGGVSCRFAPGKYNAGDVFALTIQQVGVNTSVIGTAQIRRN